MMIVWFKEFVVWIHASYVESCIFILVAIIKTGLKSAFAQIFKDTPWSHGNLAWWTKVIK